MVKIGGKIQNIDRLMQRLRAIGGNADEALKKGVKKATELVAGDARLLCPVGETGELRASITTKYEDTKGIAYTNKNYSGYVEFGTGQRGNASDVESDLQISYREDWAGQTAQPYLYPALKQNKEEIKKIIREELRKEMRRHCSNG